MRTVFYYIFLTLHLLIYTEVREVLFAPFLIEHFREHRAESEDLSFLDFLLFHYFSGHGSEPDKTHDALPFAHSHANILAAGVPIPPALELTYISNGPVIHICHTDPFIACSAQSNIWQPPRLA